MPMWTIDGPSGGLGGCIISQTATETQLSAPDGSILGTVSQTATPPDITFVNINLPGVSDPTYTIVIQSFTSPPSTAAKGTWEAKYAVLGSTQSGEWTAQAGVGARIAVGADAS